MSGVEHSLVYSFQEVLGNDYKEDVWLEENRTRVVESGIDDPHFCSASLVFIPSENMGFSVYRTTNCIGGRYIGFMYAQHVKQLAAALPKLQAIMDTWSANGT